VSNKRGRKAGRKQGKVVGFLGVGLDNKDGEHRLTRSEYFLLVGGSHETHARMQDTAIKFTEALHRRGKTLPKAGVEEITDLLREAGE